MPSIPQSLLWISLVVLWLFVLVPMLISKRDAVRRTSDVALATRVLNSSRSARLLRARSARRRALAATRDWRPTRATTDGRVRRRRRRRHRAAQDRGARRRLPVVTANPTTSTSTSSTEDSGALPVGASAAQSELTPSSTCPTTARTRRLADADEESATSSRRTCRGRGPADELDADLNRRRGLRGRGSTTGRARDSTRARRRCATPKPTAPNTTTSTSTTRPAWRRRRKRIRDWPTRCRRPRRAATNPRPPRRSAPASTGSASAC